MDREDLGALFARVARRLIAAERPLLAAHGLSMWEYIALSHLASQPSGSQLALAQAINYDKTRLITLLDQLEGDGLVTRTPDPSDRRARIVQLTLGGQEKLANARSDIRAMETEFLRVLSPPEEGTLFDVLPKLATEQPEETPGD
jgi:DNA-binding MarR family transcriptional regulator